MFDQLKEMAVKQLTEKMFSNSLGQKETQEAASEGSNVLMDLVKNQIAQGGISQVQDLFSKGGNSMESNGIFQNLQGQLTGILQNKGMSQEEAQAEAAATAPNFIDSIRDKFESKEEADSAFDLGAITNLIPGKAGEALNTINKLKNLF